MIFPKKKVTNRKRGNEEAFSNGLRCLNRLCKDAFFSGKRNIRRASPYGPEKRKRWICTSCGKTFADTRAKGTYRLRKIDEAVKSRRLKEAGLSLRQIARILGVAKSSILKWVAQI